MAEIGIETTARQGEIHLTLPGGEVFVHPRQLGMLRYLKTYYEFMKKALEVDRRFYSRDSYNEKILQLRCAYFCEPTIPESLWNSPNRYRSTTQIKMERQRPWFYFKTRPGF